MKGGQTQDSGCSERQQEALKAPREGLPVLLCVPTLFLAGHLEDLDLG